MTIRNRFCGQCGSSLSESDTWPKKCSNCGITSYLNPIPVVVVILPLGEGIILIRRGIEPAKGTLTLPGGYMDLGETWQEAGSRELREETGIEVAAEDMSLYDVMNGLDDTVVIFGLARAQPTSALRQFSSAETEEIVLINEPMELGFPMHTLVVTRYFNERQRAAAGGA